MIKQLMFAAGFAATMVVASAAQAAPCAGFTDVDSASPFCPNVEWLKNRGVTTGCTSSTLFCPTDPVSRLAMAAFMQRLADALLPSSLVDSGFTTADIDEIPPTGIPALGAMVCVTDDLPAANFPRRAIVDITTAGIGQHATTAILQFLAVSTNGGVNWSLVNETYWNKQTVAQNLYYSAHNSYLYDIPAGQVVRYGIFLSRYQSVAVPGVDIAELDCNIRRVTSSRTGAASPFDASKKSRVLN